MKENKRIALVTGAGGGIGQAVAVELARGGDHVIVVCRSRSGAEKTLGLIKASDQTGDFISCDVGDATQVDAMMEKIIRDYGRLDVLVNNAGISNTHTMDEINMDEWDRMMDVNLKGPFLLCRDAFGLMKSRGYGRIVNISSIAGERGALYSGIHYAASKGGLLALTKSFALRGAAHGITVNAVSPGTVDTPMSREEGIPSDNIPLGRAASPEEVAHAVCFLACDRASYLTGVTLDVNGGQLMR
ncbi:SDR family oxidoreductase [Ruminococcus sp. OA3]|uniref:SDR family NAD(P)-dependent oxidoreductase n=1 Tax=Ruminococcus sp. OA3 TaxID=2914164 RepID=UPI001F06F0D4|nr:SDR family NAD(P)-dependent oxidoreductase [Ruminococcus sp. OA3]MCH1981721.1 SDR family oxidoreductase [Ruminococcus sp. OA3]